MKGLLFRFIVIFVLCGESVSEGRSKFDELRSNGREIVQLTTLRFNWKIIILSDYSNYSFFMEFYTTSGALVGNWSHVQQQGYKNTQWQRLEMRMVKEYSSSQEKLIINKLGPSSTYPKEEYLHLNATPTQVLFKWTGSIQVLVDLDGLSVTSVPAGDVPGTSRPGKEGSIEPYGTIIGIAAVFVVALVFLQCRASRKQSGRGAQVISTITSELSRIHIHRPTVPPRPCTTRTNAVVVQTRQTTSASEAVPRTNAIVVQSRQTTSASDAVPQTLHFNRRTGSTLDENGYITIEEIANISSAPDAVTDPSHANRVLDRGVRGENLDAPVDAATSSVGQLKHLYDDTLNTTDDTDSLCGHIYETVNEIQFSKDLRFHTYDNTKNRPTSK